MTIGASGIGPIRSEGIAQAKVNGVDGGRTAAQGVQGTSEAGHVAYVSSHAAELAAARGALAQVPAVRADRVAELRGKLAAGTYRVDGETVANALLRG